MLRESALLPTAVLEHADARRIVVAGATRGCGGSTVAMLLDAAIEREAGRERGVSIVDAGWKLEGLLEASAGGAWRFVVVAGGEPVALAAAYAVIKAIGANHPGAVVQLLLNRRDAGRAMQAFQVVQAAAERFLGHGLRLAGSIPDDDELRAAVRHGQPTAYLAGHTRAGCAAQIVAARLLSELDDEARRPTAHRPHERRH